MNVLLRPRRPYKRPSDDMLWNACLTSLFLALYIGQLQVIAKWAQLWVLWAGHSLAAVGKRLAHCNAFVVLRRRL